MEVDESVKIGQNIGKKIGLKPVRFVQKIGLDIQLVIQLDILARG